MVCDRSWNQNEKQTKRKITDGISCTWSSRRCFWSAHGLSSLRTTESSTQLAVLHGNVRVQAMQAREGVRIGKRNRTGEHEISAATMKAWNKADRKTDGMLRRCRKAQKTRHCGRGPTLPNRRRQVGSDSGSEWSWEWWLGLNVRSPFHYLTERRLGGGWLACHVADVRKTPPPLNPCSVFRLLSILIVFHLFSPGFYLYHAG